MCNLIWLDSQIFYFLDAMDRCLYTVLQVTVRSNISYGQNLLFCNFFSKKVVFLKKKKTLYLEP